MIHNAEAALAARHGMPRASGVDSQPAGKLTHAERRHSFRVSLEGRASIWMRNRLLGHYTVRDLSIGGCGLVGGPRCAAGAHVDVVLHLPERPALWVTAQVRRVEARDFAREQSIEARDFAREQSTEDARIGLAFEHTAPRVEDRLQDVVVEVYTRMHAESDTFALVIEPRAAARHGIVQRLDALGERAHGVATPLDAVQILLENGERVHSVFIGSQRPEMPSYELIEFVARNYPHIRRVLVGDAHEVAEAWLAEATGDVHALLETPFSEETLRKLVQRISSLPEAALS